MKHRLLGVSLLLLSVFTCLSAQAQVLDANDPVITYNPNNPPKQPPYGEIGKWVRTKSVSWNTDVFKAYIYKKLRVRLMFPKNWDRSKKYPIVTYFHGGRGNNDIYDNEAQIGSARKFVNAANAGDYDGFVLYPQSYGGFPQHEMQHITEFIEYMVAQGYVDPYRATFTGNSNGGKACWNYIMNHPLLVAEASPISGLPSKTTDDLFDRVKHIPINYVQGGLDKNPTPSASGDIVEAVERVGGNITYWLYPEEGHGASGPYYREDYSYTALMRFNKLNPWPLYEQREFCSGEEVSVRLGLTAGFEAYQWRKDGAVISGATGNELQVSELGTYDVRVKRNGEWSYWSPEPVIVKIKDVTQTPPIKLSAGYSQAIPAPSGNTTQLALPEGYKTYEWRRVGSSTVLGRERVLRVDEPGEYEAVVTEKFGCSSIASTPFVVFDANSDDGPTVPTSVDVVVKSRTALMVKWGANANATGFEIYRSTAVDGEYTLEKVRPAGTTNYQQNNLKSGTTYYYIVRALDANGASAPSPPVSATTDRDNIPPSAPGQLIVSNTYGSARLSWKKSTDDIKLKHYAVYKDEVQVAITKGTEASIFGLSKGDTYRFTVRAQDEAGNFSAYSNEVVVNTIERNGLVYDYRKGNFTQIPSFNRSQITRSGAVARVNLSPRGNASKFGMRFTGSLYVPTDGEYTFFTESDEGSMLYIDNKVIVDNGGRHERQERSGKIFLEAGKHDFKLTYFNGRAGWYLKANWAGPGFEKEEIPASAFLNPASVASVPAPPKDLVATAASYDRVSLAWVDNSQGELSFQLYGSKRADGPFSSMGVLGANSESYQNVGLEPETTYYYKLRARSANGNSVFSNTVSMTTSTAPVVMPEKLYTARVNFTQNTTAPSPWYNTSKAPAVGDEFSNLPDEQGSGTGINVKLLSAFGGSYNQGASTGNNSGIVPDAALLEYYWFGIFGAPNTVQVEISGLDPRKLYGFSFVASSVFSQGGVTDNGTTVFSIGDRSASVYAQGNTSEAALLDRYAPDGSGKVVVTLSKASGTKAGYLNAMMIDAFTNPAAPAADVTQVDAYGVSKSAIQVDWTNVAGATGYELYRSATAAGGFSKVYSGNNTSYTNSGLPGGRTYYYKVKTITNEGVAESRVVPGASLKYSSYVNMNGNKKYNAPYPWNNFGSLPIDGDVFGNIRDERGHVRGMALEFRKSMTGANDWGLTTGDDSGVYPDKVMNSFFFMETFEEAELVIKGLDQSLRYNFVFFNSINQNFSVTTDFTIGGETAVAEASGNTSETQAIRGVDPDANGEIVIRITSAENWSIFNAMVVEAYSNEGGLNARKGTEKPVVYNKSMYQGLSPEQVLTSEVYPNPFKEKLRVHIGEQGDGVNYHYVLSDLLGRTLQRGTLQGGGAQLDLSDTSLKAGTYLLTVSGDSQNRTFRIIRE